MPRLQGQVLGPRTPIPVSRRPIQGMRGPFKTTVGEKRFVYIRLHIRIVYSLVCLFWRYLNSGLAEACGSMITARFSDALDVKATIHMSLKL